MTEITQEVLDRQLAVTEGEHKRTLSTLNAMEGAIAILKSLKAQLAEVPAAPVPAPQSGTETPHGE